MSYLILICTALIRETYIVSPSFHFPPTMAWVWFYQLHCFPWPRTLFVVLDASQAVCSSVGLALTSGLCSWPPEALHSWWGGRRVCTEVHPPHLQQGDAHREVPDGHLRGEAHRDSGVAGGVFQVSEVHWWVAASVPQWTYYFKKKPLLIWHYLHFHPSKHLVHLLTLCYLSV